MQYRVTVECQLLSVRKAFLIPSDFLMRTVTSNFRDMKNLMPVVFGLLKMSFWVPKKGQLSFSESQGFREMDKKARGLFFSYKWSIGNSLDLQL